MNKKILTLASFNSNFHGLFLGLLKKAFFGTISASMIAIAAVNLNSCGGGGGGDDDSNDPGAATRGPANTDAFAGSVVSFNPTLSFFSNGVLEYSNENTSPYYGSIFPTTSPGIPVAGTYSYQPSQDFQTGTLTISLPTLSYNEAIPVTEFVTAGGLVQSFKLNFPNEGSYTAYVVSGTIPAASDPQGGGSGGSGGGSTGGFTFDADGKLVPGTRFTKTYATNQSTIGVDSSFPTPFKPRVLGETEEFVIASDGSFQIPAVIPYTTTPYIINAPFLDVLDNGAIIRYRVFDASANGTITITMETKIGGILTILWEEDLLTGGVYDYDQQVWN
jgi:hypothetical protein